MIVIHREPEVLSIFNPSIPQYQSQNMSGKLVDVGDCGRLRCLQGKADTNISCVCVCDTHIKLTGHTLTPPQGGRESGGSHIKSCIRQPKWLLTSTTCL